MLKTAKYFTKQRSVVQQYQMHNYLHAYKPPSLFQYVTNKIRYSEECFCLYDDSQWGPKQHLDIFQKSYFVFKRKFLMARD